MVLSKWQKITLRLKSIQYYTILHINLGTSRLKIKLLSLNEVIVLANEKKKLGEKVATWRIAKYSVNSRAQTRSNSMRKDC